MNTLTVSDIERLAKAGVAMALSDINVVPDPMVASVWQTTEPVATLSDTFWQRWHRAHPPNNYVFGVARAYDIHASAHGDKVYVFVMPNSAVEPFILQDAAPLYPSDKLMAELALWESTNK